MKSQNILMSGGGIAGCTLAYFLKKCGHRLVVTDTTLEFKHKDRFDFVIGTDGVNSKMKKLVLSEAL